SSRRRHTRFSRDWSSDVCSSDLLFLKFGRDAERQSDKLGVEYSTKIGYDAEEMAGFFNTLERLGGESGDAVPTFLSTHPDPSDQIGRASCRERVETCAVASSRI